MFFSPLLKLIKQNLTGSSVYNLTGSSAALLLALCEDTFIAVELTEEGAEQLGKDINFFRDALKKKHVFFLPDPNGPAISGERARLIHGLKADDSIISSFKNCTSILWSPDEIKRNILTLEKGMIVSRTAIEEGLRGLGYKDAAIVSEKGEYRRRRWLIDIYPSTSELPLRIEFFGDEIESIKFFEVDSQRSTENLSGFNIFPAEDPDSGVTLLELTGGRKCFLFDSIRETELLPVRAAVLSRYSFDGTGYDAGVISLSGLGVTYEERKQVTKLPEKIKYLKQDNRIVIIASSHGQGERLKNILRDGGVIAPIVDRTDVFEYEGSVSITIGDLSAGLFLPGFMILTEKEIFGGRPAYRSIRKSKVSGLLTSLDDLRPGDFVVHRDHGIGRFLGLMRQKTEGVEEDLMLIEYEGGRLYLPITGINSINKYLAEEGVIPKIDRLGGKTWQKTKERVKKKIYETAEKLIPLYAEREIHKGFTFSPDTELHREFESFFPYEETPDQIKAVEDIKKDMESDRPMDRLICGDVGYGKTEVAMRAAFKAVYDGLQVAVLVPTTILCEQHFRTFKTRFSAFPVRIDYISRFKSQKKQKETLKALSNGEIDIIIGTHGLLKKNIGYHKLGLLIIDEEHRFGVRQKERIKELKRDVDVLTLTATPIPRTLYMALSSIREMSVIETPPEERLAVKTVVSSFDAELIRHAVHREHERNGQVFFVHNRVKDIYKIADYLKKLLPEIKIGIAHGQMDEKNLEQVMLKFYEGEIDLLLSTAIIGSGLDIPTANTIIIDRAHTMGLADLYQLRGRVGRGKVKAYAYLLIPGEEFITVEAKRRLQAVQEMSYLGAGFRLALKDLEIRGAGNLLGEEQSGHIHAVGFDLYMEMLEKAIAEFKGIAIEEEFEPSINLKVRAFIPDDYLDDVTLRLSMYRRIASARTQDSIKAIESEIEDRFGRMPDEVKNLLDIMRLKIMARELRIKKIQDMQGYVSILFSQDTKVEPHDIFGLQKEREKMRFLPEGFEIDLRGIRWHGVYKELSSIMTELSENVFLPVAKPDIL